MSFKSKVVLITGAASGFGAATANAFAKLNAKLALIDINEENLKKTAEQLKQITEEEVFTFTADITKDSEVKNAIDSIVNNLGRIDVLVNNAGTFGAVSLDDPNVMNVYDRVMAINLRSQICVTHHAVTHLIKTKGCIVNTSSSTSDIVTMLMPYSLSKAGVNHFTKCAALELSDKGIRVNAVLPGTSKTNLLLNMGWNKQQSDAMWENGRQYSPFGLIDVEDVAELIVYLSSDKAKHITGSCYLIDSGFNLGKKQTSDVDHILQAV